MKSVPVKIKRIPLSELDVVGYATVLNEQQLPSIVPPIFRKITDSDCYYTPPYLINKNVVTDATVISESDVMALMDHNQVTMFPVPIQAETNHTLWVDQMHIIHYFPNNVAEHILNKINKNNTMDAIAHLRDRDYKRAEEHSSIAINADDRTILPFVIKAAIGKATGDPNRVNFMYKLLKGKIKKTSFVQQVDYLLNNY